MGWDEVSGILLNLQKQQGDAGKDDLAAAIAAENALTQRFYREGQRDFWTQRNKNQADRIAAAKAKDRITQVKFLEESLLTPYYAIAKRIPETAPMVLALQEYARNIAFMVADGKSMSDPEVQAVYAKMTEAVNAIDQTAEEVASRDSGAARDLAQIRASGRSAAGGRGVDQDAKARADVLKTLVSQVSQGLYNTIGGPNFVGPSGKLMKSPADIQEAFKQLFPESFNTAYDVIAPYYSLPARPQPTPPPPAAGGSSGPANLGGIIRQPVNPMEAYPPRPGGAPFPAAPNVGVSPLPPPMPQVPYRNDAFQGPQTKIDVNSLINQMQELGVENQLKMPEIPGLNLSPEDEHYYNTLGRGRQLESQFAPWLYGTPGR